DIWLKSKKWSVPPTDLFMSISRWLWRKLCRSKKAKNSTGLLKTKTPLSWPDANQVNYVTCAPSLRLTPMGFSRDSIQFSMSDAPLLTFLILIAALLYSSVGHGGASGYLAAMALFGLAPAVMKPTALVLNLLVA